MSKPDEERAINSAAPDTEEAPLPVKTGTKAEKDKGDRSRKKPKKKASPLFTVVCVLVVLALVCLAVSIVAPDVVDRVFRSTPVQRGAVVMTIGEYEVTAEEYYYVALTVKSQYEANYGQYAFDKNPDLERQALSEIESYFKSKATQLAYARQMGIELTPEAEETVAAGIADMKEANGEEFFLSYLAGRAVSEELFYKIECDNWVMGRIQEQLFDPSGPYIQSITDEQRMQTSTEAGLMSAKHILITGSSNAAQDAAKLALAQQLLDRIRAGEDFETLAHQYTEDEHTHDPVNDLYNLGNYERPDAYEDAVYALEAGEISDIVTVENEDGSRGYYIIMRTVPDYTVLDQYIVMQAADAEMTVMLEETEITYGRGYKYIRISQFTAPEAGEPAEMVDNPDDAA